MRPVPAKSEEHIAREWDQIAKLRAEQIESGRDISYHKILMPCIKELSSKSDFTSVIDIGCGTGFVTLELAKEARRLVAVDLSQENVRITKERLSKICNVTVVRDTIERFALTQPEGSFTLVIANMTLITALSLGGILQAIARLLAPGGHFVFTITHPWFWPFYWGYEAESWFEYTKETIIESPFRITLQEGEGPVTTHVHRSLEHYIHALRAHGFDIETVVEPMPDPEAERLYPEPWKYPRFVGARCLAVR